MKNILSVFLIISLSILPVGGLFANSAPDRGNVTAQEYGDAVYVALDKFWGLITIDYNHTGIFSGLNQQHHGRVRQATSPNTITSEVAFDEHFTDKEDKYYGAYTLSNRTMTFDDRRSVVKTALDIVNAGIDYPSTFLQIPVCIRYYGSSFDGTVSDISNIRCDCVVEFSYEKNNFRVWRNQRYDEDMWSVVLYPDLFNNRPDNTRNPDFEPSPWAQRGAPCATGPYGTSLGCSYDEPDTRLDQPAIIHFPEYEVTEAPGDGFVDVAIRATDESGIHYIGYMLPDEDEWKYSPTQPQDPHSDSYTYTVRVETSGYLYVFAMDNGGNYPSLSTGFYITVEHAPDAPLALKSNNTGYDHFLAHWESIENANGYRLDVAKDSLFTNYLPDYQNRDVGNVTSHHIEDLDHETEYFYRVRAYNKGGTSTHSNVIRIETNTPVGTEMANLPTRFELKQNYPNPFNPITKIGYALPEESSVKLEVYNVMGQKIAALIDQKQEAGWHEVSFDANQYSTGIYLYRLQAGEFTATRVMAFVK